MKINLFGAQLLSAEIFEGVEIFYSSPISINSFTRGVAPIIFPQFGNFGGLKKYGFARDLNWIKLDPKLLMEKRL